MWMLVWERVGEKERDWMRKTGRRVKAGKRMFGEKERRRQGCCTLRHPVKMERDARTNIVLSTQVYTHLRLGDDAMFGVSEWFSRGFQSAVDTWCLVCFSFRPLYTPRPLPPPRMLQQDVKTLGTSLRSRKIKPMKNEEENDDAHDDDCKNV